MLRTFIFLSLLLSLDCAAAQDKVICFNPASPPAAIVEACTALIEADPLTAQGYQARGVAWYRLGEFDHAIADYTSSIDIDPKYIRAYYNRALAWEARGDNEEALDDLRLFVSLDSTSFPDAHTAI